MELSSSIRQLQVLFTERQLSGPLETLTGISRFFNQSSFNLLIVGGHLVGRATPVNTLAGRELLPVDSLGLETAHFVVKSGETDRTLVSFVSGGAPDPITGKIPWDKLLASGGAVKEVSIQLVDEWLEEHSLCMDIQPSLDREEVTPNNLTRLVPPADGMLFVISATTPVSLAEKHVLELLQTQGLASRLAVVLTRIEHVAERERAGLLEHVAQRLRGIAPGMLLVEDSSLHGTIETWVGDPQRAVVKENIIRRRLVLLIDQAIMQWIEKRMELEQKDEQKRKELLKIRFQTEQKALYWEEIRIATGKRANQCRELIRTNLEKAREMTMSRLKYDLAHTNNPRQWWENDLPFKVKTETENLVASMERTIESKVLADIDWIQGQVKNYFSGQLQMASAGANLRADEYETRPPAEDIKDINRSRYTMILATGGVTASLYLLGFVTFGWGAMVGAASTVLTQEIMSRKLKEQQEALSKSLESGVVRHYDKILTEAAGKVTLLYDNILEAIRKEQGDWAARQEGLLEKRLNQQDPALAAVTELIGQLETIKGKL
jgi:hypothetical protein